MSDHRQPERHELGKRIIRPATDAERSQHAALRVALAEERDEIAAWARNVAGCEDNPVAIGTVFTAAETPVVAAIDAYAASHDLPNRAAVVREALARLLDIPVEIEPKHAG